MQARFEIGIDEAGRGPLAGPVAVGVVKVAADFDWGLIPGVGDSKKVSPINREAIYGRALQLKKAGKLDFAVVQTSATYIDAKGIVPAIRLAMKKGLAEVKADPNCCYIKLDGSLKAPIDFLQETIIKGDAKELVIGLASILAKVTRDRYMETLSRKSQFINYAFDAHKGYGTKEHRRQISHHGISTEHRASYCQNRHLWGKL